VCLRSIQSPAPHPSLVGHFRILSSTIDSISLLKQLHAKSPSLIPQSPHKHYSPLGPPSQHVHSNPIPRRRQGFSRDKAEENRNPGTTSRSCQNQHRSESRRYPLRFPIVPVSFPRTILTVGAIFSKDPTPEDPLPFAVPPPGPPIHYSLEFRVLSGVYGCHTCVHLTDYLF